MASPGSQTDLQWTFKSSINVICLWWIYSVGLSILCYFLHNLISYVLSRDLCIQNLKPWIKRKVNHLRRLKKIKTIDKDDYTLNFDDVISTIRGTVTFWIKDNIHLVSDL